MSNRYEERPIYGVDVNVGRNIQNPSSESAYESLGVSVDVRLRAVEADLPGPGVTVQFSMPSMPNATLEEIEQAALTAAHEMIVRLARDGVPGWNEAQAARVKADLTPIPFMQGID